MNTHKTVGQGHALVITDNFVEAADVSEALSAHGFAGVTHCRDAAIALDALTTRGLYPVVAIVSFREDDAEASQVLDRLQELGCKIVVVNGNPKLSRIRGLAFLQRPFSDDQLEAILDQLLGT